MLEFHQLDGRLNFVQQQRQVAEVVHVLVILLSSTSKAAPVLEIKRLANTITLVRLDIGIFGSCKNESP